MGLQKYMEMSNFMLTNYSQLLKLAHWIGDWKPIEFILLNWKKFVIITIVFFCK